MKKLIIAAIALCCVAAFTVQAQDATPKKAKKEQTAEQKAVMKDILAKYDTNKDGKLDKTERAAISQEDKDKMTKAGLDHGKKKTDAVPKTDDSAK